MADRLTEGNLEAIIRSLRAEGKSFEAIARSLALEHGIEVTSQTVWNWWQKLEKAS